MKVLRRLYRYVTPYRAWAFLALFSMLVVAASTGALIALVRPLFDDVLSADQKQQQSRDEEAAMRLLRESGATEVAAGVESVRARWRTWWDAHQEDRWKY